MLDKLRLQRGSGKVSFISCLIQGTCSFLLHRAPKPRTRNTLFLHTHRHTPSPGSDALHGGHVVWRIPLTTGSDLYFPFAFLPLYMK